LASAQRECACGRHLVTEGTLDLKEARVPAERAGCVSLSAVERLPKMGAANLAQCVLRGLYRSRSGHPIRPALLSGAYTVWPHALCVRASLYGCQSAFVCARTIITIETASSQSPNMVNPAMVIGPPPTMIP
jgi:hypothetical protein